MYPKSHSFKWQKVPEPRQFDVMAATLNHMTSIFKGWKSVPIKNNAKKPKRHRFQKHSKSGLTSLEELSASCQSTCIHKSAMNNSESCRREIPDAYTHWHPPDHRQLHPKWEYRAKLHLKTPRAEKSRKRCAAHAHRAMNRPGDFVTVLYPTWFTSYFINSHNCLASGKKELLIFFAFPDQGSSHIFIAVLYYAKKKP